MGVLSWSERVAMKSRSSLFAWLVSASHWLGSYMKILWFGQKCIPATITDYTIDYRLPWLPTILGSTHSGTTTSESFICSPLLPRAAASTPPPPLSTLHTLTPSLLTANTKPLTHCNWRRERKMVVQVQVPTIHQSQYLED